MSECANRDDGVCPNVPVEKIAFFNTRIAGDFWLCQKHLDRFKREQDIYENN